MTGNLTRRHIHLDPVGGIAGDMFIAAMLDAFPDLLEPCWKDLQDSGVLKHVDVSLVAGQSHGLAVKRLCVNKTSEKPRATGHYRDLKLLLQNSALVDVVKARALALLELLAAAESRVHGVAIDDVHFHEVADWDSVADIVAAASVIENSAVSSWSCARLPTGSGLVNTEHGMLPVPAPATLALLEGMVTWDDGEPGERVTPTGAAIARYVCGFCSGQTQNVKRAAGVVMSTGTGAGQRDLSNRPNILRCSVVETSSSGTALPSSDKTSLRLDTNGYPQVIDEIAQLSFAIDDMSSEELAIALQYIRQFDGVVDVSHSMSFGKKGRMMFDVVVMCLAQHEPAVSRLCFSETSTLGVRVQLIARRVLKREMLSIEGNNHKADVKLVHRPAADTDQNQQTKKAESDDLRRIAGLYERREHASSLLELASAKHRSHVGKEE